MPQRTKILCRKTGYLLLANKKGTGCFSREASFSRGSAPAKLVCFDPKTREIRRGLSGLVKRGVTEIFVIPVSRLPKRATQKDIPLAIEAFRKSRMHLDFHYSGQVTDLTDFKQWREKKWHD